MASYDTRGDTSVRGSLPAGNLFVLLKDLRNQPGGWFAPAVSTDALPLPLRSVSPVRVVEVLPAAAEPPAPVPPPPAQAGGDAAKVAADLRAAVDDPARQAGPVRVEMVFDAEPLGGARDLLALLRTADVAGSADGLVGVVGSVRLDRAADVPKLSSPAWLAQP